MSQSHLRNGASAAHACCRTCTNGTGGPGYRRRFSRGTSSHVYLQNSTAVAAAACLIRSASGAMPSTAVAAIASRYINRAGRDRASKREEEECYPAAASSTSAAAAACITRGRAVTAVTAVTALALDNARRST
jgi:hypothetical protein